MKANCFLIFTLFTLTTSTIFSQENSENEENEEKIEIGIIEVRLGAVVGATNSIFYENPTNAFSPIAGLEFEILDPVKLRRHALVLQLKQTFKNSETKLTATQFSFNYRFKFIQSPKFDAYVSAKFAAFTALKREVTVIVSDSVSGPVFRQEERKGNDFSTPGTFGLGADYKVGNGYITFAYNDIVGVGVSSNGEFPAEFTLGYKFVL